MINIFYQILKHNQVLIIEKPTIIINATAQIVPPIKGWYLNQANPIVTINSGILTNSAPIATIKPAVPFKNPPTNGIYPKT